MSRNFIGFVQGTVNGEPTSERYKSGWHRNLVYGHCRESSNPLALRQTWIPLSPAAVAIRRSG